MKRIGMLLRRFVQNRGPAAFLAAALGVGVIVGAVAALLVTLIEWVQHLADRLDDVNFVDPWLILLLPAVGLLVAWFINRRWGPGISGGGVSETMVGLSLRSGYLPTRTIGAKLAATVATLGSGASGGREGPAVQLGATLGSSVARYTRFGEDQIRSLVAAGAGAGIGASFNAPIAGMLFAVEVVLGNFAIRHLNAVVVASVAAAVTTRSLVGEESILSAPPHFVIHPAEMILYAAVGLLAFLLSIAFLRLIHRAESRPNATRMPDWSRPMLAGLAIGFIGLLAPEVLGTGQSLVRSVLRLGADTDELWWVLGLLAVGKMITYALTLYGDGSAGEFMPSLFIGAVSGGALAIVIQPVWGFSSLNPGAFAVVGMAATFAAVARAPLTSILIVFEITGDYGLVLPLMLAASLATFLADRFHPDSAYTLPLKIRGIHLPRREDVDLLDTVTVGEVMSRKQSRLAPDLSTAEALAVLERQHHHGLPVIEEDRLVGILTLTDIRASGGPSSELLVRDVMSTTPITVTPSMPVSSALARMAALEIGRMPVVSDDDPRRLEGMFRRESVVHAYHQALGATTDRALYRQRLREKTVPGAAFFEMVVSDSSPVVGLSVSELAWPDNATLVSLRRGGAVIIPHGETVLSNGDTLTVFGSGDARESVAWLLEPKAVDS
ncbi:MAG: CBS domain-containing protein [Acidimicrobiia bacterium]|nr:CBS domain-containing protein [Acidimicrobiia bacterium]